MAFDLADHFSPPSFGRSPTIQQGIEALAASGFEM